MAAPVISSVVASPDTIPPGGTSVVTVMAIDPDSRPGTLTATVRDSEGNVVSEVTMLTIADALSYELADTDGLGLTIVQRAAPQDHIFDVTAP